MPPEEDRATATGDLHKNFRENRSSGSGDMLAGRQTDTQNDRLIAILLLGRSKNDSMYIVYHNTDYVTIHIAFS